MAEETMVDDSDTVPTTNGVHTADADGDVQMDQFPPTANGHSNDSPSHLSPAPVDSAGPPTSRATSNFDSPQQRSDTVDDDEAKPPPAKRARKYSDADQASIANTGSPPPITASSVQTNGDTVVSSPIPTFTSTGNGISTLSPVQHRFCLSTIRSLKKLKDASAFVHPVDPVALNIPHYPTIIKNPMDLSTIERKLMASNPAKPETSPNIPRYYSAEEFVSDVRLVFSNCITFNGPDHVIAQAGKHVEAVFDKQIKQLPPPAEPKPPIVKKIATPPPPPPPAPPKKVAAAPVRRPSTSVPVIRRNEAEQASARPKREIHPPPPKDLPYADVPKKMRKVKVPKDDGTGEQLKYCGKILSDLQRKQHQTIAAPFYEPVDAVKLDIPTYYRVIKKPMDMSTMRKKLEAGEYPNASKFFDDFKLMIRNCFLFNPAGTPVNQAGIELQRLFDEKWKNLPPLRDASDEEEEEEEDEESEEERNRGIATMEAQIESMRGNLMALKAKPAKEKKKKEKKEKAPVASTSKAATSRAPKAAPATNGNKRKTTTKKPMAEDDALSFEQKKDLSEAITSLDGVKLEKVIQIIHEGVPEIRDSTEEIELEIDILPPHVLTKLYNFVLRPLRQPTQKRNRTGKGTGTGGLKRKSMDETAEAEKIRKLEERMRLFDDNNFATPNAAPALAHQNDSDHSSDSSSDDSSGSESE
ncbi:Bromodomain-containing protein [Suillus bovinus]|uniref:Bromodomain-containing protein n=1 Tax=Suillus bovinus TaxID=48563 RepID=UPI001B87C8E9|nr:Bromodomain-containing protein [Suillus bovinus]KAG2160074.1 Bromodomain-containing protein [Suillus bovinus]